MILFLFFTHIYQVLSIFWTSRGHRCSPFSPPVLAFNFYRAQGSAIPLLLDFLSDVVANSRSRAFCEKSICAQKKSPRLYTSSTSALGARGDLNSRNKLTFFSSSFFFSHIYFPASGQAVVKGVVPSSPRFSPSIFIAHRVQQSHCSSIFHRVLLTHALALAASQFVRKKKPPRIYTSLHSTELKLTKMAYTRLEDNLIRHRSDYIHPNPNPMKRNQLPNVVG